VAGSNGLDGFVGDGDPLHVRVKFLGQHAPDVLMIEVALPDIQHPWRFGAHGPSLLEQSLNVASIR
jgi:hypothetical protein